MSGHDWVDLGLPSGTKWATCNIGATSPEDYGDHFAWGETSTKTTYNWSTYRYCNGSSSTLTKYCYNSSYGNNGFTDALTTLESSDDAATANWGSAWRMPTYDELNELKNNCTVIWKTQNGVNGRLFTGPNGNSIFLPAAGYRSGSNLIGAGSIAHYCSSSLYTGYPSGTWYLGFSSGSYDMCNLGRDYGRSVRPVCVSAPAVSTNDATNITTSGATLNGNVTHDGGATVTERGFVYGTSADNLSQNVQCGAGTGTYSQAITGLNANTTYYYKAYATNSQGTRYGEVVSFTTPSGKVGDYFYVDLGLPSGTKWATCNVGATNPEDYGNYFAWGETTTKEIYNWSTYIYCNGSSSTLTKYCSNSSYGDNGFTDALTTLEASDDAATANWGSAWRMPTRSEFNELKNNCTKTWTTQNGVNGRLFTGPNGNSIFLPAAGYRDGSVLYGAGSRGYYWSSSLYTPYPYSVWPLLISSDGLDVGHYSRLYGFSVRAVCQSQN